MIAVVHLVWGPLGPSPLRRFVESYRKYAAGAEHELVVLFNEVDEDTRPALIAELDDVEHRLLTLENSMLDLGAYAYAATRLKHDRLCFLNSHSTILEQQWLAKLAAGLERPDAGLVGATGSWASLRSAALDAFFIPNPYRALFPSRRIMRAEQQAIQAENELSKSSAPYPARHNALTRFLKSAAPMVDQVRRFDGFPVAHIRTNGFMVERIVFSGLHIGAVKRKMDAYDLESGRNSVTRQVERRGLRALIVASDGTCYEPDAWPNSRTFWQGNQEALLIADNQTRLYESGGIDRRRLLSVFAWGGQANPLALRDASVTSATTGPLDTIGNE